MTLDDFQLFFGEDTLMAKRAFDVFDADGDGKVRRLGGMRGWGARAVTQGQERLRFRMGRGGGACGPVGAAAEQGNGHATGLHEGPSVRAYPLLLLFLLLLLHLLLLLLLLLLLPPAPTPCTHAHAPRSAGRRCARGWWACTRSAATWPAA